MEGKVPDKFKKKALREQQKRIQPGECMKYIRLVLDENISCANYGPKVIEELKNNELSYHVRNLPFENTIIWERNAGQRLLECASDKGLSEEWQIEKQVFYIITEEDLSQKIKANKLFVQIKQLQARFPQKRCTMIVLSKEAIHQNCTTAKLFIELQIDYQINCQQLTIEEFILQLQRFTKAIAESPLKQQRAEMLGAFKNFLANDKKQCVRVVGRDGLSRLWQQHLNRMVGVTLHFTDTIMEQYSCPKKLLNAYEENIFEAENLLADLRIKRSAQSTQNARRIGQALSAKYYKFYTSLDPNEIL